MHPSSFLRPCAAVRRISMSLPNTRCFIPSMSSLSIKYPSGEPSGECVRSLHSSAYLFRKKNILSDPLPVRARTFDVKVLLLAEDGTTIGTFSKAEAQRMAKEKELRFVSVEEYPALKEAIGRTSVHPIYQLMAGEKLHQIQLQDHADRKAAKRNVQKTLQLTTNATDHDVDTKIRQAETWLQKGDEVKVLILGRVDSKARMGDLHQDVLTKLKPYAKSTISGLSKTDRNISFLLEPLTVAGSDAPVTEQPKKTAAEKDDTNTVGKPEA